MSEITINLNSEECTQVLSGLLEIAFRYEEMVEAQEMLAIVCQLNGDKANSELATAEMEKAKKRQAIAHSAYNKIKAEAIQVGLIHQEGETGND